MVAALAVAVVACGSEEAVTTGGGEAAAESGVPAGVAKQYATIEEEVRAEGGETTSGPWRIAYIVEPAEGWFERTGGKDVWRAPAAGETHHIEIVPIEAATGRVVPEVPVILEVLDAEGDRVARKPLRLYHAEFFHYAQNFSIREAGDYTLRATIEAPRFARHGEESEQPPLGEGAQVEFDDVRLDPEQG